MVCPHQCAIQQAACVMLQGSATPTHSISLQEEVSQMMFQLGKKDFSTQRFTNPSASGLFSFFSTSVQIADYLSDSFSQKKS